MVTIKTNVTDSVYATWGHATNEKVAVGDVFEQGMSNLAWALNGNLSEVNFTRMEEYFDASGSADRRSWAKYAINESKVQFDPFDGHYHGDGRDPIDGKIKKKNLDTGSIKAAWTALEGRPGKEWPHGVTMLGGIYTGTVTSNLTLISSHAMDGITVATATVPWTNAYNFIEYTRARWWKWHDSATTHAITGSTGSVRSPFCPGVMPIILAQFSIYHAGGENPVVTRFGRYMVEQQSLDTLGYNYGFWVWWDSYGFKDLGGGDFGYPVVNWMAIGPGGIWVGDVRIIAKDFPRSRAPEDGEIIQEKGDVLVAVDGQYISLRDIRRTLTEIKIFIANPHLREMLKGYAMARNELETLGVQDEPYELLF